MKRTIKIVFVLYFIQGLIHNLGHPITPGLVNDLEVTDMFGIFFALMSLGLAFGGPFWGILGDKMNKKGLILIGLIIYSIGQYVFGNVQNVVVMSIFRFVSGFGVSASVTLLMSYLIEKSDQKYKKKNIALGTAAMAAGASLGYLIGGWIPELLISSEGFVGLISAEQAKLVFLVQAIANTIFAVVVYFSLEDCINDSSIKKETMFDGIKSIRYLDKNLLAFLLSLTFTSIAAINLSKYLERFIIDMEYGASGVGQFVFVTGIVGILTTAFIVPQVFKLKKDITVMVFINIASAIIITIVFRMSNIMLALYTLYMGYMMLKAVYAPLETNFISSHSKDGEYGKIMGVRQFFFAIGFVIGPVVANVLYKIKPIYVFDMSVIMFMMAFVIILVVRKNINKEIGLEIK